MSKTPDQLVGQAIQERRVSHGYSQGSFAEKLRKRGVNWSQGTLSRVELGERPVRLVEAAVVAASLGVELDVLLREGASTEDKVRAAHAEVIASIKAIPEAVRWATATLGEVQDLLELAPDAISALGTPDRAAPKDPDEYLMWFLRAIQDVDFDEPIPYASEDRELAEAMLAIADFAASHAIGISTGPNDEDVETLRKPKIPAKFLAKGHRIRGLSSRRESNERSQDIGE